MNIFLIVHLIPEVAEGCLQKVGLTKMVLLTRSSLVLLEACAGGQCFLSEELDYPKKTLICCVFVFSDFEL